MNLESKKVRRQLQLARLLKFPGQLASSSTMRRQLSDGINRESVVPSLLTRTSATWSEVCKSRMREDVCALNACSEST